MRALVVTDVQEDFVEGGSLEVAGGRKVAAAIRKYLDDEWEQYSYIVATKCWHPEQWESVRGFNHFSKTPDFNTTWPPHCVQDTPGAEFADELGAEEADFDAVFHKGMASAAYSGFEGRDTLNNHGFNDMLTRESIKWLDFVGIAFDHCVKMGALDARKQGYKTRVLKNLTVSVSPENDAKVTKELEAAGVEVVV